MYPLAITLAAFLLGASPGETPRKDPGECPITGRPALDDISLFREGDLHYFCSEGCLAEFRAERENRLSPKESEEGWRLLFNGRDLEGFVEPTRNGKWEVRNGVLTGYGGPGVLGTRELFDHFELRADVRVGDTGERRGNSGVFIRSRGLTALRGRWPDGLEIQVDHGDPNYWTGAIWKRAKAEKVATRDDEWFHLRIEAKGKRVRVWVNGEPVTDYRQTEEVVKGAVAFQVHHATDVVEFKNVKLRVLDPTAKKPGEGRTLFVERFDGELGAGWTWLRENRDAWRIRDGALEIRVEPGDGNTVRNALLRKAPDRRRGAFAIEVTITNAAEPTRQYEQAGITWYRGGKPVFKLVKELVDGELCIIPGRRKVENATVGLRLLVSKDRYTAQYRPGAKGEFVIAARGKLPPPADDERVSIQCYHGPPDAEHWIRFDDFRILELRDSTSPDAPVRDSR